MVHTHEPAPPSGAPAATDRSNLIRTAGAQLGRGFLMGAADIVPGVSGGTVALVLGIYEQFLGAIRQGAKAIGALVKGDVKGAIERLKAVDWLFLIPLGIGVVTAVGVLSSIIDRLLVSRAEEMAGLFLGLVIASMIIAWELIKEPSSTLLGIALGVGAVAFVVLGFSSGPISDPPVFAYFFAGAIAICAMILPGISGSFILLMMGMYAGVLGAVHDREIVSLGVFMVGAVIGLALFSTLLGWLLDNYQDIVLAVLVGLMIGSIRVLWPWPNGVGIISEESEEAVDGTGLGWPDGSEFVLPFLLAVGAFLVVMVVSRVASLREESAEGATLGV